MFVQERHERIVSLLHKNGKVLVKELSEAFAVTEDCIRKDLAALEKQSLLKRAYGGAVLPRRNSHQVYVADRKEKNTAAKRIIAEKALALIQEGDMVFLDISTSNIELAKLLLKANRPVSIVTNMLEVMMILSAPSQIRLTFIGGMLNDSRDGFVGNMAIHMLSQLRFDLAFLGTAGVDIYDNAVFTYMQEDGFTKREIVRLSRQPYLLAELEKFQMGGNFQYAQVDQFQGMIVEQLPEREIMDRLAQYPVEVI